MFSPCPVVRPVVPLYVPCQHRPNRTAGRSSESVTHMLLREHDRGAVFSVIILCRFYVVLVLPICMIIILIIIIIIIIKVVKHIEVELVN